MGIVGQLGIIDLGLGPTVIKQCAEALATRDITKASHVASLLVSAYLWLGILFFILSTTIAFAATLYIVDAHARATFTLLMILVGLQGALAFPCSVWTGLLAAMEDYHIANASSAMTACLRLAFTWLLLQLGYGILALIGISFFSLILSSLFAARWVRHRIPELTLRYQHPRLSDLRPIARISWYMFIWSLAGKVLLESDRIIVGIFVQAGAVTVYEIGLRITTHSRSLINTVFTLLPSVAHLNARGHCDSQLRSIYVQCSRFLFFSYGVLATILFVSGPELIYVWLGNSYDGASSVMSILVAAALVQSQNAVGHVMLPATNRFSVFAAVMAGYPLINISLSVLLARTYGMRGVALATLLTFALGETILLVYTTRAFQTPLRSFVRKVHWPTLATLLPALLIASLLDSWLHARAISGLPHLASEVACILAVVIPLYAYFGLDSAERTWLKTAVLSLGARRSRPHTLPIWTQ